MPTLIDLTAGKVKRGRLVNFRTGDTMEFALNPSTFSFKNANNLAEDAISGSSDVLIRWMSSKVRPITFTLFHDGEITLRVRGSQFANGAKLEDNGPPVTYGVGNNATFVDDPKGYSIAGALEFLDSFTYPVDPSFSSSGGGVDKIVLHFGSYMRGIVCVMDNVDHEITEFDPDLNPTKAKSTITLKRYNVEQTFAHDVWEAK